MGDIMKKFIFALLMSASALLTTGCNKIIDFLASGIVTKSEVKNEDAHWTVYGIYKKHYLGQPDWEVIKEIVEVSPSTTDMLKNPGNGFEGDISFTILKAETRLGDNKPLYPNVGIAANCQNVEKITFLIRQYQGRFIVNANSKSAARKNLETNKIERPEFTHEEIDFMVAKYKAGAERE